MTGHPSNGWAGPGYVSPRQHQLARLRTFCLLNAILYLLAAILVAFLRFLVDERVEVAAPVLVQELLCAVWLVVLAALLLRLRGAITRDPAGQGPAVRAARGVRTLALLIAALCAAGAVVVLLLPIPDSTLPTALISGFVVASALYTYAGAGKATAHA